MLFDATSSILKHCLITTNNFLIMHYYIYVFINSHHAFRCDQIYIETLPYYN